METIELNRSTESRRQTTIREPLPAYDANGEEANPSPPSTGQAAGPEPRPVPARRALRQRLWEQGILVLEDESLVVGPIDKDLTTQEVPSNPRRDGQRFRLRPDQELVFVPSTTGEPEAQSFPLCVHRRRTVVRIRPDAASRYGELYKLLSAAETSPKAVGEDLGRLTWTLLYDSIRAAKKAERVLCEASGLLE